MAEARSTQQHLLLLPSGQVGEAFGRSGAPECKKAVDIEIRKSNEGLFQLSAAYALDRIASEAVTFPTTLIASPLSAARSPSNQRAGLLLPITQFPSDDGAHCAAAT